MNLFGWEIHRKTATTISIDQVLRNMEMVYQTMSAESVTPENCMRSPTVHAIVSGISKAIASLSFDVYEQTTSNKRANKQKLPNHPVAKLLNFPNDYQTRVEYWLDATSALLRYGRYYAYKGRGQTGPIRDLHPLVPSAVQPKQDNDYNVTYEVTSAAGETKTYTGTQLHTARTSARNFFFADSWILDCREAIALEIAAEKFGATLFGNGAMPGLVFEFMEGFAQFKTDEEKKKFIDAFQQTQSGRGRFRSILLPKGIKLGTQIGIENEKAQFLETRKYQRLVIAGSAGVPPYMVGDLERQTFNNAEQQSINKIVEVVLPVARIFEAAMERDLLTDEDRRSGIIIRFNLDAGLRGDFKTRQDGLKIQREAGVICANDWREDENMNPISEKDGGEEYWRQGASGQSAKPSTPTPSTPPSSTVASTGGKTYAKAYSNGH